MNIELSKSEVGMILKAIDHQIEDNAEMVQKGNAVFVKLTRAYLGENGIQVNDPADDEIKTFRQIILNVIKSPGDV
jgi:hypothetical protein